jgi:hypothetical protein
MVTIEIQVSDELAQRLAAHRHELPALLEAGLRARRQADQAEDNGELREQILRVLAASGRVRLPVTDTETAPPQAYKPAPITGQPVSEIVIEQRGPR